jgi:hypothetical protein
MIVALYETLERRMLADGARLLRRDSSDEIRGVSLWFGSILYADTIVLLRV